MDAQEQRSGLRSPIFFARMVDMTDSAGLPVPRTARDIAHQEMQRRILDAARAQLATVGPAQLSLRAVARDLGVVSSAVYRYVSSRDELLTQLIVVIFQELGDAVQRACSAADPDPAAQWHTWAHALRSWALNQPYDWALIYGIPIPGYAAPTDTIEPARRVNQPVLALYSALGASLQPSPAVEASEEMLAPLRAILEHDGASQPDERGVATAMMLAWSGVHGFITLELGGHFEGSTTATAPVFTALVEQLGRQLSINDS